MKTTDIVLCKKSVKIKKPNFTIDFIKNKKYLLEGYDSKSHYFRGGPRGVFVTDLNMTNSINCWFFELDEGEYLFSDYFITIKELRKQKLNAINRRK